MRMIPILALWMGLIGLPVQAVPEGPPPTLGEVQGSLEAVDLANQTFAVRDSAGRVFAFKSNSNTRILDPDNRAASMADLRDKTPVRVYFNTPEQTARQVDILRQ
jgi:hypothetical protein